MDVLDLQREFNLDTIQKYVLEKETKKDVSNEMFHLFFGVIELGKNIRMSLKDGDYQNTKLKIADIFLGLIYICNDLDINLFDTLTYKEDVLNEKIAKWF